MSKEWLSAHNFERLYNLISSINTISIHHKLEIAGYDDSSRLQEVEQAKNHLMRFLDRFESIIKDLEQGQTNVVVGADPRLSDLAHRLVDIHRKRPYDSMLATVSIDDLEKLLSSKDKSDRKKLINCLRDLRKLLEQNANTDVVRIIGEI